MGQVIATMSLPAVLGPILGPALGGLIPTFASWRWMFWVNVLFCVVRLVLAVRMPPADRPDQRARLDLVGLALLGGVIGWAAHRAGATTCSGSIAPPWRWPSRSWTGQELPSRCHGRASARPVLHFRRGRTVRTACCHAGSGVTGGVTRDRCSAGLG
ncbi:MFS transporter [Cellulomonas sp.]|uniref:MFS transporter n=1 Tax=Cellulomonas sp. TaxID=40001 RepID=UPI00344E0F17